ncbi:VHS1099 protein [Vibrio phage 1]|nr:VHS1099 protein [Vibrio phage 1]
MHKNALPHPKPGMYHGVLTVVKPDNNAFYLYCGSFRDHLPSMEGIKLAPELPHAANYELPIVDFSIPDPGEVLLLIDWMQNKTNEVCELYLGCNGGYGRTGLIAACVLIAFEGMDAHEAIKAVRSKVHAHCIETNQQVYFVINFAKLLEETTLDNAIEMARLNQI